MQKRFERKLQQKADWSLCLWECCESFKKGPLGRGSKASFEGAYADSMRILKTDRSAVVKEAGNASAVVVRDKVDDEAEVKIKQIWQSANLRHEISK